MQLDLFGPCKLVLDIRDFVRKGGAKPNKACACTQPCWWRDHFADVGKKVNSNAENM